MIADAWLDGWGVLVWLASAAFWILVIAGIVVLLRSNTGRGGSDSALRILEERYARGEVTREEFIERRAVLTKDASTETTPPPPNEPPTETKPL